MPLRTLAFLLPCLLATLAPAQTPSFPGFQTTPSFPASGTGPAISLFPMADDFNHDGKRDIVTLGNGQICFRAGNGDGTFGAPVLSTPPDNGSHSLSFPIYAFQADFNGDGYPDILVGSAPSLQIYVNQKDGTFTPGASVPPLSTTGSPLYGLAVGATTTSGAPDVVTLTVGSDGAILATTYLNDGTGAFPQTRSSHLPGPLSFGSQAPVLADTDHDGKLDLLFVTSDPIDHHSIVDVQPGNGDGTFQQNGTGVVFPLVSYTGPNTLRVASLSGDPAKQDILLSTSTGPYVALNQGNGAFGPSQPALPQSAPFSGQELDLLLSDLNGDGKPDLITTQQGGLAAFLGAGDGSFGPIAGTAVLLDILVAENFSAAQTVLADFNGDGKPDLLSADSSSGYITVGFGRGDGSFNTPGLLYSTASPSVFPLDFFAQSAADLNGDGLTDIVGTSNSSQTTVSALATGKGSFQFKQAFPGIPTNFAPGFIHLALDGSKPVLDLNGDGKPDLLLAKDDRAVDTEAVYDYATALGNGDGTFQTPIPIPLNQNLPCGIQEATAGDINGDGKTDLIAAYGGDVSCLPPGALSSSPTPPGYFVAFGNGDGSFGAVNFVPDPDHSVFAVALAPFHGKNSPLDLILSETVELDAYNKLLAPVPVTTSLLQGKGDGTFGAPSTLDTGHSVYQLLTADYNGDGVPDLTVLAAPSTANGTDGGVYLYPGKGDGSLGAPAHLVPTLYAAIGAYADVNNDGFPDLLLRASGPSTNPIPNLSVLLGTGGGQLAPPVSYSTSLGFVLLTGNFLGDNTVSLVSATSFDAALLPNLGGSTLTLNAPTTATPGQSIPLTATLTPTLPNRPAPTGQITFLSGTTILGSEPLAGGTATLTTAALPTGADPVAVRYSGDPNFLPDTSAAATVTVAAAPPPPAPDFTLTPSATTVTVARGSTVTVPLTLAANAAFSGPVTLACSGLPPGASCAFTPVILTAGQTATTTLTLSTAAPTTAALVHPPKATWPFSGAAGIPVLLGGALLLRTRRMRAAARQLLKNRSLLALLFLAATSIVLAGCGGSSKSTQPAPVGGNATPTGTSTLTVTATSGSLTHTTTVTLTVQ